MSLADYFPDILASRPQIFGFSGRLRDLGTFPSFPWRDRGGLPPLSTTTCRGPPNWPGALTSLE